MKKKEMYLRSFQIGLQNSMEYRFNFILSIFSTIVPTITQLFLWNAMFESSATGRVYGYTYSSMIMYTILAGVVSKLMAAGCEWSVAADIRDGGLNKYIVKPIGYFRYQFCCFLGQKSVQSAVFTVILAIILVVAKANSFFSVAPVRLLYFAAAVVLGILINMFLGFMVSAVAFWITEAWSAFLILGLAINIASGGVFPLDIFGEKVVTVLKFLPFQYTVYFPINILNGNIVIGDIFPSLCIQVAWIVILAFMLQLLWKIGLRKYEAVGG
ncbi:ABC-2 type transport system permease protein [Anaerocolumna jejuensis DSM 15929]|uniref:ABC-2 type transport system permease protein n=1 Tax=Anaerocolumna jejuensis DSM 15929 TaxID=1121322 RepID=A0A1M6NXI0_9FIRM|nr:ABC-2 family transporter protein [Anaerocolumna jejuensis]SHK00334.1 ABC-2 type transport system permease protein [Anaerocolumna jejuensis DSM 15929]